MADLNPEQHLELARQELAQKEEEGKQDRTERIEQRTKDRKAGYVLAIVSGGAALTGGLGSQIISHYDKEQPKAPTYVIQVSDKPVDTNLTNTILRVNPETGETWYARKSADGSLGWVRVSNPGEPSNQPAVVAPLSSPSAPQTPRK